jgi:hypothetical protein
MSTGRPMPPLPTVAAGALGRCGPARTESGPGRVALGVSVVRLGSKPGLIYAHWYFENVRKR